MSKYQSAYHQARKKRLMAAGLCYHCGHRTPEEGRTRCEVCRAKGRENTKATRRRQRPHWIALGLCPSCGTRIRVQGESRCAVCCEQQAESHAKARARKREMKARAAA